MAADMLFEGKACLQACSRVGLLRLAGGLLSGNAVIRDWLRFRRPICARNLSLPQACATGSRRSPRRPGRRPPGRRTADCSRWWWPAPDQQGEQQAAGPGRGPGHAGGGRRLGLGEDVGGQGDQGSGQDLVGEAADAEAGDDPVGVGRKRDRREHLRRRTDQRAQRRSDGGPAQGLRRRHRTRPTRPASRALLGDRST